MIGCSSIEIDGFQQNEKSVDPISKPSRAYGFQVRNYTAYTEKVPDYKLNFLSDLLQFEVKMILEVVLLSFAIFIGWILVVKRGRASTPKLLAPGPRPYPIIGNLPSLAGKTAHVAMTKLADEYGKIFTLYLPGGQRCAVINSIDLAREALVGKRDEFAGRPLTFIGDSLSRGTKNIICADFTQTMLLQRKIAHSALRMYGSGLRHLEGKICEEVEQLAKRFSAQQGKPVDPKRDIVLTILNVICAVVYGERYDVEDEEFTRIIEYNDQFIRLFASFNILDLLPWLRFLPLENVRILHKARATRDSILDAKYHAHKQKFDENYANNNFEIEDLTDALLKAYYDAKEEDGKVSQLLTEDHLVMTMNDVFNAGLETTATTLRWLLAYMVTYPEVQARVHAELDDIIGPGRLPRLDDRGKLPYLESTIAEVLRISTIVPLSLPHKATCDTSLGGYDIPKDTVLISNLWAIHHDKDEWEEPDVFNPERFIDSQGKFAGSGVRSFLPFSAGRRGCLGESLAKTELFLVASRLLQQFTFENPHGKPLPDLTGIAGVVFAPGPYEICIKERV